MSEPTLAQKFDAKFFDPDTKDELPPGIFDSMPGEDECWMSGGMLLRLPHEERVALFDDGSGIWWATETDERNVLAEGEIEPWLRQILRDELRNLKASLKLAEQQEREEGRPGVSFTDDLPF